MKLLLALCMALMLSGQSNPQRFSSTTGDVVLSGATTQFTVQQATTGTKRVQLESAIAYCSVACNISQSQNGTAATATAGTVVPIQPIGPSGTATSWTASNVGTGTSLGPTVHLTAAGTIVLDLSKIYFSKTSTSATNYTISISSITGTANITFIWSEQ